MWTIVLKILRPETCRPNGLRRSGVAQVTSINVGRPREVAWAGIGRTAIDKQPVDGPVLADTTRSRGDQVGDTVHHGGVDQAVYAFAREELDWWAGELAARSATASSPRT